MADVIRHQLGYLTLVNVSYDVTRNVELVERCQKIAQNKNFKLIFFLTKLGCYTPYVKARF